MTEPQKEPSPKPQKTQERVREQAPQPAGAPQPGRSTPGTRIPGEAYTPMPEFCGPAPRRWRSWVMTAVVSLVLAAAGYRLWSSSSARDASVPQPAAVTVPAADNHQQDQMGK